MTWRVHHLAVTDSTNADARAGAPGDVFTADFQTAGRGRLDHRWLSAPGENLMLSAVLDVGGLSPEHVSTLPLAVGLAVLEGLSPWTRGLSLKWPNDVLCGRRKLCGILCERAGDRVVAGLGVNVNQRIFASEVADRATSLALLAERGAGPAGAGPIAVPDVRDAVLDSLGRLYGEWRAGGLAAVYPRLAEHDALKGRTVSVARTDADASPVRGLCGGIRPDGALDVGGEAVYAGEAHVVASDL